MLSVEVSSGLLICFHIRAILDDRFVLYSFPSTCSLVQTCFHRTWKEWVPKLSRPEVVYFLTELSLSADDPHGEPLYQRGTGQAQPALLCCLLP